MLVPGLLAKPDMSARGRATSGLTADNQVSHTRRMPNGRLLRLHSESTAIEKAVPFNVAGQPDAVVAPRLVLRQLHLFHRCIVALAVVSDLFDLGREIGHVLQQILDILL